jgi:hypothetical protein
MPSRGPDRLERAGWKKTVFEENDKIANERGIIGYRMRRIGENVIIRFAILAQPGPRGGRTIIVSRYHKPGKE